MVRLNEFGCHLVTSNYTLSEFFRYATLVDSLGFDHLKIGDHTLIPNPTAQYPNASTLLGALGVLTRNVRLSTAVTDPFRRHPVEIAQSIATLDRITNGRTALGIGAGEAMNLAPYGIEYKKPLQRLKEAVDVIKLLWGATPENPANYIGEIFSLKNAYLQIRPVQTPHPPVYIGAAGPKTRELAGAIAEGWVPVAVESPSTLAKHMLDIERGARMNNRSLENFDVAVTVYTDISPDEDEAYRRVAPTVKAMLIQQREVLKELAGISVPQELSLQFLDPTDPRTSEKIREIADSIPRRVVEEVSVIGPPDECVSRLEKFLKAGATSIIICNLSVEQERVFRTYAEKIIPYLKNEYGVSK
jgi:alkanesulfonate monooxygenase SsuD/methylene tetrahydromethanopterin reductase-like flavin-dependent oxidoreductase (luciferase family)